MAQQTQDHGLRQEQPGGCLNLGVTMPAADYPVNGLVTITGDYEATLIVAEFTTAFQHVDGEVVRPAQEAGGKGVIATRFRRVLKDVEIAEPIAAGLLVQPADDSGAGVQRVRLFETGDSEIMGVYGVALTSGAQASDTIDIGVW